MPKRSYYCGSLCDKYTCSDVENVFTPDVIVLFFGHSKFPNGEVNLYAIQYSDWKIQ